VTTCTLFGPLFGESVTASLIFLFVGISRAQGPFLKTLLRAVFVNLLHATQRLERATARQCLADFAEVLLEYVCCRPFELLDKIEKLAETTFRQKFHEWRVVVHPHWMDNRV
jgi:hypothetical protein